MSNKRYVKLYDPNGNENSLRLFSEASAKELSELKRLVAKHNLKNLTGYLVHVYDVDHFEHVGNLKEVIKQLKKGI